MSGFDITPTEEESLYDGTKRDVVTDEFQGQELAVLDPAGKPRVDRPRVPHGRLPLTGAPPAPDHPSVYLASVAGSRARR